MCFEEEQILLWRQGQINPCQLEKRFQAVSDTLGKTLDGEMKCLAPRGLSL